MTSARYARISATKKLTDETVLTKIASEDKSWDVRCSALNQIVTQAELKRNTGDLERAIAEYTSAIALTPSFSYTEWMATSCGTCKQPVTLNPALTANWEVQREKFLRHPEFALAYLGRGAAKQTKGDLDGAIADYDNAIQCNPNAEAAYRNRASVKKAKGDLEGAKADYAKADALVNKSLAERQAAINSSGQRHSGCIEGLVVGQAGWVWNGRKWVPAETIVTHCPP